MNYVWKNRLSLKFSYCFTFPPESFRHVYNHVLYRLNAKRSDGSIAYASQGYGWVLSLLISVNIEEVTAGQTVTEGNEAWQFSHRAYANPRTAAGSRTSLQAGVDERSVPSLAWPYNCAEKYVVGQRILPRCSSSDTCRHWFHISHNWHHETLLCL